MLRAMQDASPSLAVAVKDAPVRDEAGIAPVIPALAADSNTALLVLPDFFTITNRAAILAAAAQANLPAVYWNRVLVPYGDLMSTSTAKAELPALPASYID